MVNYESLKFDIASSTFLGSDGGRSASKNISNFETKTNIVLEFPAELTQHGSKMTSQSRNGTLERHTTAHSTHLSVKDSESKLICIS